MSRKSRFKQVSKAKPKRNGDEIAARIREAGARASAEAEARRMAEQRSLAGPREIGGSDGPEPTRYGDWERKGLISDF